MTASPTIGFIGGGNMAGALIGGLCRSGVAPGRIVVVEPFDARRDTLHADYGIAAHATADDALAGCELIVWAVKPQAFADAARLCGRALGHALHLSVMAGIRSAALVEATGSERVVRAMPNTPALIGQGIAGLYARPAVGADGRSAVEAVLAPTGALLWVDHEDALDAVTALSGSGPAYVFLFIEALVAAAERMGLSAAQGRALALATFSGATALAAQSDEPVALLRERVTSKGGTTAAALASMATDGVTEAIVRAVLAAQRRAAELGAG